jgi:hypothetical protein
MAGGELAPDGGSMGSRRMMEELGSGAAAQGIATPHPEVIGPVVDGMEGVFWGEFDFEP